MVCFNTFRPGKVKQLLCCLALVALPTLSQVPQEPVTPVAIYYNFQHEPAGFVLDSLKQETDTIMAPIGPPFEWRPLAGVRLGDVSEELAVVTFHGSCDAADLMFHRTESGSLGSTHVTDGVVLPFCDIDCDRIRTFVRPALAALAPKERGTAFGHAVARVLAHELYHIFAKTTHHDAAGVARSSFTVKELMAARFRLSEGASRPLRTVLASSRTTAADGSSVFKRGCAPCHGSRGEGTGRGPLLRAAARSMDLFRLASKLGDHRSKMAREARDLGIALPAPEETDIGILLNYLGTLPE